MPSDTTISGVCDMVKQSGMGRNRIVLLFWVDWLRRCQCMS